MLIHYTGETDMFKSESFWSFVKSSGLNPLHFEVNIMNNLSDFWAGGNALKKKKEDYDPPDFYSLRVNGQLPEYVLPADKLAFQSKEFKAIKTGKFVTITTDQKEGIFNSICEYGDQKLLQTLFRTFDASREGADIRNQPFETRYEAWRGIIINQLKIQIVHFIYLIWIQHLGNVLRIQNIRNCKKMVGSHCTKSMRFRMW